MIGTEKSKSAFHLFNEIDEKETAPVSEITFETKDSGSDEDDDEEITLGSLEDNYRNSEGWWNPIKKDDVKAPLEFIYVSIEDPISVEEKRISLCENYRTILIEFYEVHAPQKVENIKSLLQKFKKNDIKLRQLIKRVEKAYNVTLLSEQQKQQSQTEYRINSDKESCYDMSYNNKSKRVVRDRGKMVNFIDRLEKAHQSIHSFIDQETDLVGEYLLDRNYCNGLKKKRNGMIQRKRISIINNNHNFSWDEMNFQKRRLSKNNSCGSDNGSAALTTQSGSCESILTRERLEIFYRVNNPKKLNNIDSLLEKFKGREDRLFKRLEQTYNVDDSPL